MRYTGLYGLAWILPSPAPYFGPGALRLLQGAGASAFPRTPLSGAVRKSFVVTTDL